MASSTARSRQALRLRLTCSPATTTVGSVGGVKPVTQMLAVVRQGPKQGATDGSASKRQFHRFGRWVQCPWHEWRGNDFFPSTLASPCASDPAVGRSEALPCFSNWASDKARPLLGKRVGRGIKRPAWLCCFCVNPYPWKAQMSFQAGFCMAQSFHHIAQIRLANGPIHESKIADCLPWTPCPSNQRESQST